MRYVPPADIQGVVQYDDEQAKPPQPGPQPPPSGKQNAPQPVTPARLMLRVVPSGFMMGGPLRPADIAVDGSFTLQQVGPERYQVSVSWGGVYVKSMRLGDVEMEGAMLDVRNGTAGAALTVVVSSAVGQVSGTVTDSNGPVAGAYLALVPDNPESRAQFSYSRADGIYGFTGLPPGSYKLAIVDADEGAAISRGKGFQESAETAEPIEVHPGDKIVKDIKR